MQGWIKIHRQILEWEWYDDANTFRLFMHLLLKANHKQKKYRGKVVKAGSLLTGRDLLASQTGLSVQQVRTSLEKLKATNEITIKSDSQGTVIQVVKYKEYQVVTSEITNEQPTSNQRVTTNKNEKNEKKIPTVHEFVAYAISKDATLDESAVRLKYESWKLNGWKNGYNKPIKNWKSSLNNTIPHINKKKVVTKTNDQLQYEYHMKQIHGENWEQLKQEGKI